MLTPELGSELLTQLKRDGYLLAVPTDPGQGEGTTGHYRSVPGELGVACTVHGQVPPRGTPEGRLPEDEVALGGAVTAAALGLPEPTTKVSLRTLGELAGSPRVLTRRTVAVALRRSRLPAAVSMLRALARDEDVHTRKHAAWSLGIVHRTLGGEVPEDTWETLKNLREDEHERVRDFAVFAMARLGDAEAQAAIPAIAADEGRPEIRRRLGLAALRDGTQGQGRGLGGGRAAGDPEDAAASAEGMAPGDQHDGNAEPAAS